MNAISLFLKETIEKRKNKNPQYSLRAFARDLDISSGRLVNIMNGNSLPGEKILERIFSKLDISNEQRQVLLELLVDDRYLNRGLGFKKQLSEEQMKILSHWKSWALYTLLQHDHFDGSNQFLAKHSGLDEIEVEKIIQELQSLKLVSIVENKILKESVTNFTTSHDVPSESIKELHRQFIKQAELSLTEAKVNERDITGITMCIDEKNLKEAKELIADFRAQLDKLLEKGSKNKVYHLSVQLFPVFRKVQYEN